MSGPGDAGAEGAPPVAPGVFGKLPARGDFVSRGLPAGFADPWHAWLVRGLAAAREALGGRFGPAYMAAPAWRFALPAGACGPVPAAGVVLPSVDSVGRMFPLTLAAAPCALGGAPPDLDPALPWYAALEEAGRDAIALDPELEAWFARVAALAAPMVPGAAVPPACAVAPLEGGAAPWPAVASALAALGAARAVVLWCEGSPFVRPCALVAPALPEGACFVRLLADDTRPPPAGDPP